MGKLSGNSQVGALACHGICTTNKSEKILRQKPYHGESYTMSIGCWPLHLSNQLMCRNFVPNHNFKTKGGHTSVKNFQGGSVLHFTDQVDAQPRSANLSTIAINVESHTRFFSAQKGSSPLVVSEIHNQSQQGSFPHNNNLLVTPVRVSILKQFLEGYDSYLATFWVKVLNKVFI